MTRRFVVLGHPVAHSLSPAIHEAAYAELDLDATYGRRDVDPAGLAAAIEDLRRGRLDGANVTMPHKSAAVGLVDRLDPVAARLGALNTLDVDGGRVVGHATDGAGVLHAWARGGLPIDAPVLVLGAGGAARAAVDVLAGRHEVWVAARRPEAAAALDSLGAAGALAWGEPLTGAVVVNATPIGMAGDDLPDGVVEEAAGLFEMVYAPEVTPAVSRARANGLPIGWGLDMLVGQAAAAFALWFAAEPPVEAMAAAAKHSRGS